MPASQAVHDLAQWAAERARRDDHLYEGYGRELEPEHNGDFVAISDDGRHILGTDELSVSDEACRRFGSGNFALRRIGADAEVNWRTMPV
jgi:hypothetical protein